MLSLKTTGKITYYTVRNIIFFLLILSFKIVQCQEKGIRIKSVLDSLSITSIPQLNNKVDLSFSNISIKELIRTIANSTEVNITIDPKAEIQVNSNFNKVSATDVISYLCSEYNLELINRGTIIHLQPTIIKEEKLLIEMLNDSTLSYEANKIKVSDFFKEFTNRSGINFILSPEIGDKIVHGFSKGISLHNAFLQISAENNLDITKKDSHLYVVYPALNKAALNVPELPKIKKEKLLNIHYKDEKLDAEIADVPLNDVLLELSHQIDCSVGMLSAVDMKINMTSRQTTVPEFLNSIFYGSENTYRLSDKNLYVGSRKLPGIKSCELIKLNNRSVDSLIRVLPAQMTQDLTVKEYGEQNSFIVWGDADLISNFRKTIQKIDVVVPVILIDVIIVDTGKNFKIETGIEAGIGDTPAKTSGTINPGLDYTMGANSVNNILSSVGLTNLGKVSPNFYLKLKAMETDGILEIRSTPQLSTMNGHSAKMSIGQTEYYREDLTNIIGSQNPQTQLQSQYKPVEAKLAVIIKPYVTGNGYVSLTIEVEQSQFTERISTYAPPGIESRKFSSMIRIRNQEMILLGGLEEDSSSKTTKGWPLLSKIPILKWIFSSKTDSKDKKHLNIFIKPTVFY